MKTSFRYLIAVFLFGMLALAVTASAHVVLEPNEAVVGEQTYGINVPNEKVRNCNILWGRSCTIGVEGLPDIL